MGKLKEWKRERDEFRAERWADIAEQFSRYERAVESPTYGECEPCPYHFGSHDHGSNIVHRGCKLGVWEIIFGGLTQAIANADGVEPGYPCDVFKAEMREVCKG